MRKGHQPASTRTLMRTLRLSTIQPAILLPPQDDVPLSECLRQLRVGHGLWLTERDCSSIYTTFKPLLPICDVSTFVRLSPHRYPPLKEDPQGGRGGKSLLELKEDDPLKWGVHVSANGD